MCKTFFLSCTIQLDRIVYGNVNIAKSNALSAGSTLCILITVIGLKSSN